MVSADTLLIVADATRVAFSVPKAAGWVLVCWCAIGIVVSVHEIREWIATAYHSVRVRLWG